MAEFGHIAFERRYLVARGDNGHPQPAQMRPVVQCWPRRHKAIVREVAANLSHGKLRTAVGLDVGATGRDRQVLPQH